MIARVALGVVLLALAGCRAELVENEPAPPPDPIPEPVVLTRPLEPVSLAALREDGGLGVGVTYVPEDLQGPGGSPVACARAELGAGYELLLFDTSRDGRFEPQRPPFRPDGDGMVFVRPGLTERHVVPFRDRLVMAGRQYFVAVDLEDGRGRLVMTSEHLAGVSPDVLRGVERINVLRARAGLHGLVADGDCCRGCQGHAETLVRHHWTGRTNPHYGEYGRKSLIGDHARDPVHAVNANDIATYHAKVIYERSHLAVGFGFHEGVFAIWPIGDASTDTTSRPSTAAEWPRPWVALTRNGRTHAVTVYPPNGSTGNPSGHRRESHLRELDEDWGAGFGAPIYVMRASPAFDDLDLESAALEFGRLGPSGFMRIRKVDAHVFSERRSIPGEDENGRLDNILAKTRLARGDYRATFVYEGGVVLRWTFTVGPRDRRAAR